jgi:hypothetical protein
MPRSALLSISATLTVRTTLDSRAGADRERELAQAALEQLPVGAVRDDRDLQRRRDDGLEHQRHAAVVVLKEGHLGDGRGVGAVGGGGRRVR